MPRLLPHSSFLLSLSGLAVVIAGSVVATAAKAPPAPASSKARHDVAGPAQGSGLWTDADPRERAGIALPSLSPVVQRVGPAVLVVFTEGPLTAADLPPGHPPIGPGAPRGTLPPGHPPTGRAPSGTLPPGHPPLPRAPDAPEGAPDGGGGDDDEEPEMSGQGAGFLISADGYAVTNEHVIEGATRISVRVGDDPTELPAHLIGSDDKTDIALLRIDGPRTDWPHIALGNSDALHVGDFVVAIGSPFGLEQSVSLGILSARGRRDIAPSGREGLYDFLQTDASINPGNSGGPLLDLHGDVVGMNAAVNAAGSGIGFAIPINMVKRILPALREHGRVMRSWIGIGIQPVDVDVAPGLGLTQPRGALVREVVKDGPGARAGLLPGDVITSFDGAKIRDANDLPLLASDAGVGHEAVLELVRDRKTTTMIVALGSHPDNTTTAASTTTSTDAPRDDGDAPHDDGKSTAATTAPPREPTIGIGVVSLDGDDRTRLSLPDDVKGARITRVQPDSPAMWAGLQTDDVVTTANGTALSSATDLQGLVKAAASGELLKLLVRRGESTLFVPVVKP